MPKGYAAVGFFAGFNERFARDTLLSSVDPSGLSSVAQSQGTTAQG